MWWSTNLVQMLLSCVADERIPKDHHGTLGPAVCDLQVVRYARWIWIELAVKRPFQNYTGLCFVFCFFKLVSKDHCRFYALLVFFNHSQWILCGS